MISGVPQGSVLGPVLFLIYVNSVADGLRSNYKIFADDLKLYAGVCHSGAHVSVCDVERCQGDIDRLVTVAESWGLSINVDKCALMRFSRGNLDWESRRERGLYLLNGSRIQLVDSFKDLGVLVDNKLKFHGHIRKIAHKAGGVSMSLLKSTVCHTPKFMIHLWITHVRPLLEYCSVIWNTGYLGDLRLLESIQRRWTRCVCGLEGLNYSDRLRILDLYSVKGRLFRADLIQCWKMFHGKSVVDPSDVFQLAPGGGTRGHSFKLYHTGASVEARRRTFAVRCVAEWNALPQTVVEAGSLEVFKRRLAEFLGDRLFDFENY